MLQIYIPIYSFSIPPHTPLLQIMYNPIHVVRFIFNPPFPRWYYPSHKSKQCSPLSNAVPPPKTFPLSTTYPIIYIPPTLWHELSHCPRYDPQQHTSSSSNYLSKARYPPSPPGWGIYIPLTITPIFTYILIWVLLVSNCIIMDPNTPTLYLLWDFRVLLVKKCIRTINK